MLLKMLQITLAADAEHKQLIRVFGLRPVAILQLRSDLAGAGYHQDLLLQTVCMLKV